MATVTLTGGISLTGERAQVTDDQIRGRRARLVVAALILERRGRCTRERLADMLWDEDLPSSWDAATRNVLTGVSRLLEPLADEGVALVRDDAGYAIVLPAHWTVDLEAAADAVAAAERSLDVDEPASARVAAESAEAVLGRPLLPGVDGGWADALQQRTADQRVRGLEALAEANLRLGDPSAAIVHAELGVELAPYREQLHRLLMRAHWERGSRGEALRVYSRCRTLLAEAFGVDPAPATEQLYLELLGVEDVAGYAVRRGGAVPEPRPALGRDAELDDLRRRIVDARLVTISGLGGVGKSTLAGALAVSLVEDGQAVRWVDLWDAPVGGVAAAVARATGADGAAADLVAGIVGHLRERRVVVVLDGCEHVRPEVVALARAVLADCPSVRLVVTSRTSLRLRDESLLALEPLGDDPSVALFLARAREHGATIALDPASLDAVTALCRRLDGLPLAVELAAARSRVMAPGQLLAHLDERFRLLRRREGRHRALVDVLAWAYSSLDEHPARCFRWLSVFSGSFSLDAAAAVLDEDPIDLLDLLADLVDRSLVVAVPSSDAEPRYRLLESVAEYARLQAADASDGDAALARHGVWFLDLCEAAAVGVQGPEEARWVAALDADLPNVLAAFDRARDDFDVDRSLRFGGALFDFAFHRMRSEIGPRLDAAVALPGAESHPSAANVRAMAGYLAWQRGDMAVAVAHLEAARVDGVADSWVIADAWATVSLFRGDLDEALDGYERAHAHALHAGNPYLAAIASSQLSFAHLLTGKPDAHELAERSAAEAEQAGGPTARAQAAWALGLARYDVDPVDGLEHLDRCMALTRLVDNRMAYGAAADPAEAIRTRLEARSAADDVAAAMEWVEYWVQRDNLPNVWVGLRRLVRQLAAVGLHADAARLAGAEEAADLKIPPRAREREHHRQVVDELRSVLGAAAYEELAAEGAALAVDRAALVALLRDAVVRAQPTA